MYDRTNSAILEKEVLKAQNASVTQKMHVLKVPRFHDDVIKGDAFMVKVEYMWVTCSHLKRNTNHKWTASDEHKQKRLVAGW